MINSLARLLFISTFFIVGTISAQQTYVPDNNFEAYLEANGMGNGVPNDDYVTTANISGVGSLIVWGYNIADLTGIEDFSSLNMLFCFQNQLTSLDLSQNTQLSDLRCNDNQLTTLNVSNNTNLTTFFCYNNQLTSIVGLGNTNVNDLRCSGNQLTSLDVSGLSGLFKLHCQINQLTSLDISANPLMNDLRCNNNQLTALDLSMNAQVVILFCQYNQLATLNLGMTSGITFMHCHENQLTSLDVSQHAGLTELQCNGNLLTHVDITQNSDLITLYAHDNSLICLVANNGQDLDLNILNNPQLTCASVTYPPYAVANALYDPTVNFNVVCGGPINNDVDIDQTTVILSAQLNGATYQWLDCEGYEPIPGATFQSLSVDSTGYYAVELTFTDCFGTQVDTSSCVYVDCISGIDNDVTQTGATLTADMSNATYQWLDCDNNYAEIPGETNQWYTATAYGHYAVRITYSNLCETIEVDTSSCHLVDLVDLNELTPNSAELIKIVDLLGRETPAVPNTPLIYIYSDGTMKRVFKLEE
ncbi:MAG: hypothetical protein P8P74_11220 [Crocinitomicaceae bacterium]|nr:hypothetical protein [Crocinitomicaceae bacterium]